MDRSRNVCFLSYDKVKGHDDFWKPDHGFPIVFLYNISRTYLEPFTRHFQFYSYCESYVISKLSRGGVLGQISWRIPKARPRLSISGPLQWYIS